jgi:iron complex outermembrane receptor protein
LRSEQFVENKCSHNAFYIKLYNSTFIFFIGDKMSFYQKFFIVVLLVFGAFTSVFAQTGGTIRGSVTTETDGSALTGASVQIVQLRRTTNTNENGAYEFTNIAPGNYTILVHTEGFSDRTRNVALVGNAVATVDFALSLAGVNEQVTVTATGQQQSVFESFQSVNSVSQLRIREQASTSIGEVLEREAGVGKRSFGTGSARPVVRGFDGDRVLITQDGVRTGSLGSQSGDHGEPIDVLNLERLEVVKGPATLLYGSNAIGGVVNAVTSDENTSHTGLRGFFSGLGGTVNSQAGANGNIEYGYKKFLFNVGASAQREDDYHTPLGVVPNSASRYWNTVGKVGYFGDKGFLQAGFDYDKRRYGIPFAGFFESGGESNDENIDIRARTRNLRFRGGLHDLNSPITAMNFAVNHSDYQHQELEEEEVGTVFDNDTFSYRSTFEQKPFNKLTGRFGFEGFRRSYLTTGEESLVEGRVRQNNFAVFALEELGFKRVAFQFGGRVERNSYDTASANLLDRSFTGFSGAAGVRFRLWEGASFVTNFNSSYRAPALEELYNNGAHVGTISFEIGNENLRRERSNGVEFSFEQNTKRLRFDGGFFYYRINDFIYQALEDEDADGVPDIEDNLSVRRYLQDDSRFIGADVSVNFDINKYVGAFFVGDIVNAKLTNGTPLPRITPARARIGLDLKYKGLSVRPETMFVARKSRGDIFPLETPTAGYGLFNVNASYTYGTEHYAHIFSLSANNLTDKLYFNHLSYIKDLAPEPGRGIRASYTFRFF